ncbi:ABC transporter substrate-binding protein [Amorphus orientalis]|uniref:NitT/TauT family transport system substrate-binding protein n=1 Tax=Amorphus orientalis TaxID=649198 RepID=A0AAE3VPJ8_9HYPH|nr:ABC transporter substrate-binding protein [Amorphus orientalis]MDQ0315396.1 NitT/TauT family transport system substrate-binding protein [Amorphus orientalis]
MGFSKTLRPWLGATLVAAVTVFSFAASDAARANDEVVVGALRFTSHSAGFIAYEKGYFEEEGLDVEFKFFQAAQPIAVATASGDVDFGIAGVTGGFMSLADKGAVRLVAGVLHEKKGVDGMMIVASNNAYENGLDSVDKLPGHSIAMTQVGSTFHYMTSRIADQQGWDIDEVKLVPLQKVGAMIAAVKSGQVDAMIMVPHIAKVLVENGDAEMLGWLYDYAEYQISGLFTSVKNIEERRDMVERFVRAYAKGIADFNRVMLAENPDAAEQEEMVRMIHNYVYNDRPYEKAAPSIIAGAMNLNEDGAMDVTDIEKQMTWFQEQGLVSKDLTMDELVDGSFVETY